MTQKELACLAKKVLQWPKVSFSTEVRTWCFETGSEETTYTLYLARGWVETGVLISSSTSWQQLCNKFMIWKNWEDAIHD